MVQNECNSWALLPARSPIPAGRSCCRACGRPTRVRSSGRDLNTSERRARASVHRAALDVAVFAVRGHMAPDRTGTPGLLSDPPRRQRLAERVPTRRNRSCGQSKWPKVAVFRCFSSICPLVYRAPAQTPTGDVPCRLARRSMLMGYPSIRRARCFADSPLCPPLIMRSSSEFPSRPSAVSTGLSSHGGLTIGNDFGAAHRTHERVREDWREYPGSIGHTPNQGTLRNREYWREYWPRTKSGYSTQRRESHKAPRLTNSPRLHTWLLLLYLLLYCSSGRRPRPFSSITSSRTATSGEVEHVPDRQESCHRRHDRRGRDLRRFVHALGYDPGPCGPRPRDFETPLRDRADQPPPPS
jgi:hypothetical protein